MKKLLFVTTFLFLTAFTTTGTPSWFETHPSTLGLVCGPNMGLCTQSYLTTSENITTISGHEYEAFDGLTVESKWDQRISASTSHWEMAKATEYGWWQSIGWSTTTTNASWGFSDIMRTGCCEPADWWENTFSTWSLFSSNFESWSKTLQSDGVNLTLTIVMTGKDLTELVNYFRNAGGSTFLNGSTSFSNVISSSENSSNSWKYVYQETYADPNAIPEPMTFVLMGAGLVGIVTVRRRKSR